MVIGVDQVMDLARQLTKWMMLAGFMTSVSCLPKEFFNLICLFCSGYDK
jgi:hypothetical protein